MPHQTDPPPGREWTGFFPLAITLWSLLVVLTVGLYAHEAVESIEGDEYRASSRASAEISARLAINEAVLNGFAHLVNEGANNRKELRRFADEAIARFPHIYMLEVVTPVPREELPQFVARTRAAGLPDFQPRRFDYSGSGGWAAPNDKPIHYLLSFMAPETPAAMKVYGLDVADEERFMRVIEQARSNGGEPASMAFRLAESGELAYLMVHSEATFGRARAAPPDLRPISALVVRMASLLPTDLDPLMAYELRQMLPGDKPGEAVLHAPAERPSRFAAVFEHRFEHELGSRDQRFRLSITRPIYVEELLGHFWPPMLLLASSSLGLIVWLRQRQRQRRQQREARLGELEHIALFDPLTGLPNRRLLGDRLDQAIERSRRSRVPFAMQFIDLDGFKQINDQHGHQTGDELLRQVAERMRYTLRASDTVARYGGDEFVVLMPDVASREEACSLAEALRGWLSCDYLVGELPCRLGASIGVALYPDDAADRESLIRHADQAMYAEKLANRQTSARVAHGRGGAASRIEIALRADGRMAAGPTMAQ